MTAESFTFVDVITARFVDALEASRGPLEFKQLAVIALQVVGIPETMPDYYLKKAEQAMDNIADQGVSLGDYAEAAYRAITELA